MFKVRSIFSIQGFLVFALIAVNILVVGCQKMVVEGKSALISNEGVRVEALLPDDSWMVLKMGTDDSVQLKNLDKLMSYFPEDGFEFIEDELASSFNEDFEKIGLSYKRDMQPALGDNLQGILALGGDMEKDAEPTILVVIVPKDAKKVEEILSLSVSKGEGESEDYKSYKIYNGDDGETYFARYKDVLLIGNSVDYVKEGLDRADTGKGSLLTNKHYQKGVTDMEGSLGFAFIDPGFIMEQVSSDPDATSKLEGMENVLDIASAIEGEFFSLTAEKDGFRIVGVVYMDSEKIAKIGFDEIYDSMMPAYLYKQLPGDSVVVYSESGNLSASMDLLLDIYGEMDEFKDGVAMIRVGLKSNGIDLEDDLLVFMDKGYAFGLYADDSLFPMMGMFVDASSSSESAKKLMTRVNEGIEGLLDDVSEEVEGILVHSSADCGSGECYAMTLDFNNLPEDERADMPEELTGEVLEFGYGVNGADLAYFALYPDFARGGFETLDKNKKFNEDLKFIDGFDYQITYFDVEAGMDLLDRWVQFGLKMDGKESDTGMEEYEMVKKYVKPVKSLVLGSKKAEGGKMEMQGFIKISN